MQVGTFLAKSFDPSRTMLGAQQLQDLKGKDAFIKQVINGGLQPLGYDPIGLNDNLAVANGKSDAKLL